MALTQTDVDRLKNAMATGVLTVEYEGRRVTYRSQAELERALALAQEDVAQATAEGAITYSLASHDRD